MKVDPDFRHSNSIYTDEAYEEITRGKDGKEIFVPDDNEIKLELSVTLKKERIIQKFVKDLKDNSVKLTLNNTYKPTVSISVPIDMIKSKKDGWKSFVTKFKNELENLQVEHGHILLIHSALNSNSSNL